MKNILVKITQLGLDTSSDIRRQHGNIILSKDEAKAFVATFINGGKEGVLYWENDDSKTLGRATFTATEQGS